MNFLEFCKDIESRIKEVQPIELLELNYLPYCFGHGQVYYRVGGHIFNFSFDGRDNILTISKSDKHQKHPHATYINILTQSGLNIDSSALKSILP